MIATLALLTLGACGDVNPMSTEERANAIPIQVTAVSGNAQVGVPGEALPEPLVVRAEVRGESLPGHLVNWVVVEGGGSVSADASRTDGEGYARQTWTLGPAGDQRLEVRATDPSTGRERLFALFEAETVDERPGDGDEDPEEGEDEEEADEGDEGAEEGDEGDEEGDENGEDQDGEGSDDPGGDPAPPASLELTPASLELDAHGSADLEVSAFDEEGAETVIDRDDVEWSSSDPTVASVSGGSVTGHSGGSATISAVLGELTAQAEILVRAHEEEDEDDDPDQRDFGEWDYVLSDTMVVGDVVVPAGESWLIGPNVEVEGNVRTVDGTIAMRPGSSLRFVGADPARYAGGGMTYSSQFADDYGLWVDGTGVLDIRGTPKEGWNRTGSHSTWSATDEYWIAPTDVEDYQPRRWHPGDPIPQVDPRAPAAEVMNVTRDIVIEGPGHIHIHSQAPQRIEYVRLEGLGVSREGGPVLGRYALHLHHGGWGTDGTVIRGVAATNSKGRVFVPHMSHGITMTDNVSVNSWAEALWWDLGDSTNGLTVERLAVSGVYFPREVYGGTTRFDAVRLVSGEDMTMRNSVVSGARGNRLSIGWHWNTEAAHRNPAKWNFDRGNVAHNNEGHGIRFWVNDSQPHHVQNYVSYRNGEGGVANGAYGNPVRYSDALFIEGDRIHWNANPLEASGSHVAGLERARIEADDGPALYVGHRRIEANGYMEIIDSELIAGPGHPKVRVGESRRFPWKAHFIRSGITPEDIVFDAPESDAEQGTHILIDHEDGRRWEILVQGGEVIVRER